MLHLVDAEHDKLLSPAASVNHFALRVADLDTALAKLQELGVPFEMDTTPSGELSQLYVIAPMAYASSSTRLALVRAELIATSTSTGSPPDCRPRWPD